MRTGRIAAAALGLLMLALPAFAQQKTEIKITRQPSIIYMPTYVMEQRHLVEKHAAALGVPGLKVEWLIFTGGGNATDALLAGNVDIVNTGVGNMLLLWDRTRGGVKGIVGTAALPLILVTREPRIRTLADFTEADRIAVPTVGVSTQAILLQIAAEKQFGAGQWNKLDGNTVQMSHPDAVVALSNPRHEVASHFSAPPYVFQELATVPGAHVVTSSQDILGTPLTQAVLFTTQKFADANPKIVQAVHDATAEAIAFMKSNTREAAEIYRAGSGDRMTTDELVAMLAQPGMMDFQTKPEGTMVFAEHLYKTGTLKTKPSAWTDYFFPVGHDLGGN